MTTQEVANKLVELCREGKYEEAHDTLYSEEIVSLESPGMEPLEARGLVAIKEKGLHWAEMFSGPATTWCDDPIVSGNSFACRMGFSGPGKEGDTVEGEEIAVYTVKDSKIVLEQFFW